MSDTLTVPPARQPLPREALHLLRALAEPGAYVIAAGSEEPDRLLLVAPSNGVSLRRASLRAATGAALVAADLAHWQPPGRSGRLRLTLSPAGVAKLARLDAPLGIDPFTAQHATLVAASVDLPVSGKQNVVLDTAESPLAWLARRKGKNGQPLIDGVAFQAGERLRNDLTLAQMLPHVTANWGNPASGGGFDPAARNYSDLVIAARQRIDRAFDAVGSDMSGLLLDICGFLKGLEQIELERQWPARSGKVVLVLALARLAAHYGLASQAHGPARSSGIRQWGAHGYRPSA